MIHINIIDVKIEEVCKKHKLKLEDNGDRLLLSNKDNKIEIPFNSNKVIVNSKTFYFTEMIYKGETPLVVRETIVDNIVKQTTKTKAKTKVVEPDNIE